MRISSKSMYALRALFDICFHNGGRPTKVEEIAAREEVPPRFLEQLFQDLKAAGLIGSKRGPKGGYFLRRDPSSVTVGEVVRAIEGPVEHFCCFGSDEELRAGCDISSKCVTAAVWRDVTVRIEAALDSVTISDLCLKGDTLGVKREADVDFSYVI